MEIFLHGIPLSFALIVSISLLVNENLNDGGGGSCFEAVYDPPHCVGYEDGEVPEGFDIPCGRGRDGAIVFYYGVMFFTLFILPIIIGVSLGMIYRAVLRQEKTISRYGIGSFAATNATVRVSNISDTTTSTTTERPSFLGTIRTSIHRRRSSASDILPGQGPSNQYSKSRIVLHRAKAYSIAYFLTWSFFFMGACFDIANMEWPTAVQYLTSIFNPLQGFFK